MTLVVCWRTGDGLTVAADTKISGDGDATLTEGGPKIFQVGIAAYQKIGGQTRKRIYPSMGYAYAGSSLIAQSVLAMATTCLQNLSGDVGKAGPSLLNVADLFMKCAVQYTKEMLFWRPGQYPGFEAFIFGYCPNLKDFLVYHLRTTAEDGLVNIRHDGYYVEHGKCFHIGSGVSEFVKLYNEYKSRGEPLSPFENFELVLTGKRVRSVGGSRQYASASRRGVELLPAFIPVEGETYSGRIEVLGCDVSSFGDVGEYSVAHYVIGPDLRQTRRSPPP